MSCCHESVAQQVRPGTARVLVTELSGSGQINPTPATKPYDDSDETAVELYLSPEKLESLCGTQDLCHMTSLEICVDTQEITLGDFGAFLPKLVQLKMNNSIIMSVRDLGTTLSHLQVLWMSHCCLQDLDGISTFSSLKELYVAYNSVSDLSQVGMLENLQLLDLEGNDVDDLVQVQYLGLCGKLQTLTLEGNPVCTSPNPTTAQMTDYRYRAAVRELVPQLCYLDNLRVEEDEMNCNIMMEEDWAILRNSIRTRNSSRSPTEDEETVDSVCPYSRPSSARCTVSSRSCVWSLSSDSRPLTGSRPCTSSRPRTGSRPLTSTGPGVLSPPGSRPGSAGSDLAETSILTHGAGKILFCGNPFRAIQARRDKLRTAPTRSTFTPHDLPIHVPEHTYDLEECDVRERTDVFAELRAWREQHNRRLQAIETERLPQVLAIHHNDDEEEEDDGEEGFSSMENDCSEEQGEEKSDDSLDTTSPDSFLQSLSPDLCHREDLSSDVAQLLSLTPDTRPSPSPPVSATAVSGNQKPQGIRARRFRLSQANSEHFPDSSRIGFSRGTTGTTERDSDQILQNIQHVTRTNVPLLSKAAHIPCPPSTKGLGRRLKDSSMRMDASNVKCENKQLHTLQQHKLPDRPAIARPHTARAALQKHHQHHILQPCRGSSHPD